MLSSPQDRPHRAWDWKPWERSFRSSNKSVCEPKWSLYRDKCPPRRQRSGGRRRGFPCTTSQKVTLRVRRLQCESIARPFSKLCRGCSRAKAAASTSASFCCRTLGASSRSRAAAKPCAASSWRLTMRSGSTRDLARRLGRPRRLRPFTHWESRGPLHSPKTGLGRRT